MSNNSTFPIFKYRQILARESQRYYASCDRKKIKRDLAYNYGLRSLVKQGQYSRNILECGCGVGNTLQLLWHKNATFTGIDISPYAIRQAKKTWYRKKNVSFVRGNAEHLPFIKDSFDLVYSTYVIEHIFHPEKMITEMIRVTAKGGILIIIAPNYGSPLEFSPCFPMVGLKPTVRSLQALIKSYWYLFFSSSNLSWRSIRPKILDTKKFFPDSDTVNEPYLQTLLSFLKFSKMKITEYSSGLNWDKETFKIPIKVPPRQKILNMAKITAKWLGKRGILPFIYYGPVIYVMAKKE